MTEQHPAVVYLLAAHERAEKVARLAGRPALDHCPSDPVEFVIGMNDLSTPAVRAAEAHIRLHSPDIVLGRVAAEREILAEHAGTWPEGEPEYGYHSVPMVGPTGRTRYVDVRDDEPTPPYWCAACSDMAPCRTVLLLAQAWGWEAEA